ncbi:hypothetical protein QKW60_16790 [Defluviimonas aestuarii]|uniref:hypothetical protein n=1 Tax=Albidovulum aestuarii TaxID=1130726 RepID=UPI00249A5324|nr:hypothetical protein [Defluviimonas aestuarii]MDI3338067.1 hypothetical protein [Defluviimonas aestuarii]
MTFRAAVFAVLAALASPAGAGPEIDSHGGDLFIGGSGTARSLDAARDVFAGGASLTIDGEVAEDLHVSGFDVDVDARTHGDLYAAGGAVKIRAATGGDLSAAGFSLRTTPDAETGGNARMAGGTLTIEGPVRGALIATGGEIIMDAPVTGDVRLTGHTISFGDAAKIGGTLIYSAPSEIIIPPDVIDADRVTYRPLERMKMFDEAREAWKGREYPTLSGFMSLFAGFLLMLAFFVGLGAICLAFLPRQVAHLKLIADDRPGTTLLTGVVGLAILFGMVPVSAMTVIGLPLVPIVILTIIALWVLGYVLGTYAVAMRLAGAFGPGDAPERIGELGLLALTLTVAAVLNFIPVLGWVLNFGLVLFGIGAMASAVFERLIGPVGPVRDAALTPLPDENA